jgi:hypothetical protein
MSGYENLQTYAEPVVRAQTPTLQYCLFYAALFTVAMLPLLVAENLPLRDFQAHLGRMAILAAGPRDPFFSQFYKINYAPTGAFAMDVLLPPAVRLLGLAWAGKLFVLLTLLLLSSGVGFLNHTLFRRLSWWPALGLLLLYNHVLTWGFMNYLFGLGVLLWVLAAWLRTEGWGWTVRTACFSALAYVLLICHLYAFALYGACVASVEIARRQERFGDLRLWRQRTAYLSVLQFIPPVVIFYLTSPTAGNTMKLRGGVWWLSIKLYGAMSLVNTGAFAVDLAICAACYAAFGWALARRWIQVDRRLVWVLGGLLAAYPVWPDVIFGGGFAAYRLPVAIAFIAVAATAPRPTNGSRPIGWQGAVVALLVLAQAGFVTARWLGYDRQYAAIDRLMDQVPPGKRLLFSIARDGRYFGLNDPPLNYYPQMSEQRRQIFVNGAFVWPQDNSSISLTAPYAWLQSDPAWANEFYAPALAEIRKAPLTSAASPFRLEVLAMFDYAMVKDQARFGLPPVPPGFATVASDADYVLYRIPK